MAGMFDVVFDNDYFLFQIFFSLKKRPKKNQFKFQLLTTVGIQRNNNNCEKLFIHIFFINVTNVSFRFVFKTSLGVEGSENILLLPF